MGTFFLLLRTTKGTGPARFGSAPVVTKKQELELNQPLIITCLVS